DPERTDTGCRQIEGGGGAETTGTDQQDGGIEQSLLALFTDFGEEEMSVVADPLVGGEPSGLGPASALVLPPIEASRHGPDPGISHFLEAGSRQQAALATGAVQDHRRVTVGYLGLDAALEHPPRQEEGTGDGPGGVLLGFADVDDCDCAQAIFDLGRLHLGNRAPGRLDELQVGRHVVTYPTERRESRRRFSRWTRGAGPP